MDDFYARFEGVVKDVASQARSLTGLGARIGKLEDRIKKLEGGGKEPSVWECEKKIAALDMAITEVRARHRFTKGGADYVEHKKLMDRRAELEEKMRS